MRSNPRCWNTLFSKLGYRRRLRAANGRASSPRRPRFETLESRQMLTTFVVNYAGDVAETGAGSDGKLTLREALIASNTNAAYGDAAAGSSSVDDVIKFAPE